MPVTQVKLEQLLGSWEVHPDQAPAVFDAWRSAAEQADDAYRLWQITPQRQRDEAFTVYRASEEREAQAAHVYETCCLHQRADERL